MSKRTERRAAERAARKTGQVLDPANSTATPAVPAWRPDSSSANQEDLFACLHTGAVRTKEFLAQFPLDESTQDNQNQSTGEPETSTASEAQIRANRENARHSTGPVTAAGKQTVSQNRRTHGLIGRFMLQPDEIESDYQSLVDEVYSEYQPATPTECRLAESIIQHYWLMQRAIRLQEINFRVDDKKLALYTRYQTTHERSYYKAQKELQKLKKEAAKEQIGFEQQNQKNENLDARTRLIHAKARSIEIDTACRQVMEAPVPGNTKLSFEELTKACSDAIGALLAGKRQAAAA